MHRHRDTKNTPKRRAFAALVLGTLAAKAAFAGPMESASDSRDQEPETLPYRDISSLLVGGASREVSFDVSDYRAPDGKRWIRMSSDFESAYRIGMDDIIATLWDFADAPKTFSRIDSVRLRSDTGTVAVIEQRTGVRVLGFSYLSTLVFREDLLRQGKRAATLRFKAIEVDSTTLSTEGSWTLEDRSDASGPLTYVRYAFDSCVAAKYPVQAALMRRFGPKDIRRVLRELGEAAVRRTRRG
jgi:hypothetical protein